VYVWLWKDGAPAIATEPRWVRPGDTYHVSPTVAVSWDDRHYNPLLLLMRAMGNPRDEAER
jgi:hypothetical protein